MEGVVSLSSSRQVFSACEKRGGGRGVGAQTQAGVSGVADLEKRRKGRGLRQGGRGLLGAHH